MFNFYATKGPVAGGLCKSSTAFLPGLRIVQLISILITFNTCFQFLPLDLEVSFLLQLPGKNGKDSLLLQPNVVYNIGNSVLENLLAKLVRYRGLVCVGIIPEEYALKETVN